MELHGSVLKTAVVPIESEYFWASFVNGRNEIFMDNKLSRIEVLGEQTYMALGTFYSSVARLFTEGRLGGAVITGIYRGPISTTNTGVLSDEL